MTKEKSKTTKATKPKAKAKTTKPKATAKKRVGRPSKYTQELADKLCAELAQGKSMRTVCKSPDMPIMSTIF
ncbi:MAG: hypothetical protein GY787_13190, partial [Alteromonadales bacterium]|nr:hypothetical protein [Alteromonadales bacterium]